MDSRFSNKPQSALTKTSTHFLIDYCRKVIATLPSKMTFRKIFKNLAGVNVQGDCVPPGWTLDS